MMIASVNGGLSRFREKCRGPLLSPPCKGEEGTREK